MDHDKLIEIYALLMKLHRFNEESERAILELMLKCKELQLENEILRKKLFDI